jgi:hypothetical protein
LELLLPLYKAVRKIKRDGQQSRSNVKEQNPAIVIPSNEGFEDFETRAAANL